MMEGCITRELSPRDAEAAINLLREVAAESDYLLISPSDLSGHVAEYIEVSIVKQGLVGVVLEHNNEIVGQCMVTNGELEATRHVGSIGVAVKRDWRGRGFGKRLVEEAMELSPCKVFVAECFEDNKPSINLFVSLGYLIGGGVPNYIYKNSNYHNKITLHYERKQKRVNS